ncbi:MAG: flavin reductase [Saprospiraceae bacterium]
MQTFTREQILHLDKYFRVNLINNLCGVRTANMIGTIGKNEVSNLAIFNSVMHIGASPPLMGFILRPLTVERHTYENILDRKFFTINQVHEEIYQNAHKTSAKYDNQTSEFEACGFTEYYHENFPAPFVKESHIKIGLSFAEAQTIRSNNTLLVVGNVEWIIIPDALISKKGRLLLEEANAVGVGGLDSYYSFTRLATLEYARPGKKTLKVDSE